MSIIISSLFSSYYFLRERLPFIIYFIYLYFEDRYNRHYKVNYVEAMILFSIVIIGGLLGISLIGLMSGMTFYELFMFKWQYSGLITWSILFFIFFFSVNNKIDNTLKSYVLSILAVTSGGWIYEIPFFHPLSMFINNRSIFYINGQIIYTLLFAYELFKIKLRFNKRILLSFTCFFALLIITMFKGIHIFPSPVSWFCRLPTALFIISLVSGIEKKRG